MKKPHFGLLTLFLLIILFLESCERRKDVVYVPSYGYCSNSEMKLALRRLNEESKFPKNTNLSDQGVTYLENTLSTIKTSRDSATVLRYLAEFNLRSGHSYKSIERYSQLKNLMSRLGLTQLDSTFTLTDIDREIAVARFRNSEQVNCQLRGTANSCIFPFRSDGVHLIADDAKESRRILLRLLNENPHDPASLWLLNIENSALGYPSDSLPSIYRIKMDQFEAPVTFQPFRNVAIQAGVSAPGLAGGAAAEDFNNDGLLDIVVSSCGLYDPLRLFINKGDGTFEEQTHRAGLDGITGGLNLTTCDYNNDGYMDIFLMRGGWMPGFGNFPNSLLRNNGNGTFTDVTISAGLFSLHPTHSSAWVDFNHDGWLDVFVGHETSSPNDPHPSEFYINNKDGTFTECSKEAGINIVDFVKGVVFTDINNDGWEDIYISCSGSKNYLLQNTGMIKNNIPQFRDVTAHAGVSMPINSFSVISLDINNDGWEDLYVADNQIDATIDNFVNSYMGIEVSSHPYVYINQKNGTYAELSAAYHLHRSIQGMGLNTGDIDHDGYPDIYCGTGNPNFKALFPNVLLHNINGDHFEDITMQTRTGDIQKGHGIAICDIDNDGDEDIYEDMGGFYKSDIGNNVLFENPDSGNNYIGLQIQGTKSDKSAAGARIEIIITENQKQRHIYKTVSTGGSFGTNSYRQTIGVSKANIIDEIRIYYPTTGIHQTFRNVRSNRYYSVVEDSNEIKPVKIKAFHF